MKHTKLNKNRKPRNWPSSRTPAHAKIQQESKKTKWEETPTEKEILDHDEVTRARLEQLRLEYDDAIKQVERDQQERRHSTMSSATLRSSEISNAWASRQTELAGESEGKSKLQYLVGVKTERQSPALKLVWELQVKTIPTFNGERDAGLINEFLNNFTTAMQEMKTEGDESLMNSIFTSKLGHVHEFGRVVSNESQVNKYQLIHNSGLTG
jgi:hypothetical protein